MRAAQVRHNWARWEAFYFSQRCQKGLHTRVQRKVCFRQKSESSVARDLGHFRLDNTGIRYIVLGRAVTFYRLSDPLN
jgi:hypothetical protein